MCTYIYSQQNVTHPRKKLKGGIYNNMNRSRGYQTSKISQTEKRQIP